jgi:asparagine synthase (glutamine-hydrolysing)
MCGLAGFVGYPFDDASVIARAMADSITHRGPDSSGVWFDRATGCALAHRRLAIVELSEAGHQPMKSAGGRYVLAFNGEIYNHLDLRAELGERAWRGHSDTETLLAGFEAWGVQGTLERSVGMFAIAVWDRVGRVLHLARDRIGEKPLYYGWMGDVLVFGSELKALQSHPAFRGEVDREALVSFVRHGYLPAPRTIWRDVVKLGPGTLLSMPFGDGARAARGASPVTWWSLDEVIRAGAARPFAGSESDAVDALDTLLTDSVRLQSVADVPLGAFLSGGIDSSAVVATMQKVSSTPVKTFTIGFDDPRHDESTHAAAVARHLGTEHHEQRVTETDALELIPKLPSMYDEPFADASQIPTALVCAAARRHVTVALSGDAGDELFGGYGRYLVAMSAWNRTRRIPGPVRSGVATAIGLLPARGWDAIGRVLPSRGSRGLGIPHAGEKAARIARVLAERGPEVLYRDIVSHRQDPQAVVIDAVEPTTPVNRGYGMAAMLDVGHYGMAVDTLTYLPDDILVKVDRAAMAVGLETRVPLLDHRIVEFAWTLPLSMKIAGGSAKRVLRELLFREVPRELVERPKQGFAVPLDAWLRGRLKDWAASLLDPSLLRRQGYLDAAAVGRCWAEHQKGERDWQYALWDVLMFQAWLDAQGL